MKVGLKILLTSNIVCYNLCIIKVSLCESGVSITTYNINT